MSHSSWVLYAAVKTPEIWSTFRIYYIKRFQQPKDRKWDKLWISCLFCFAFLTATFFSGYFSYAFFITVILFFHTATNRVLLVHQSIYGINQTTIPRFALTKGWRSKYQTYNLFYVQVKHAKIYTLYKPSHGRKPPGRPQKSLFVKYRNVPTPISISKRVTSCALPKTEPVGDDLQSTALRSTDEWWWWWWWWWNCFYKLSWNKIAFLAPTDVVPQFIQKMTTF